MKKATSMSGMIETVRSVFNRIDPKARTSGITLTDCLLSGLAVFNLKYASLLQYDRDRQHLGTKLTKSFWHQSPA